MKLNEWTPASPASPGTAPASSPGIPWRDILIVVAVAWTARLIFMLVIPSGARSFDAFNWEHQAALLDKGINPYQANTLFSWAPFWMQCTFIIGKIAGGLGVPFFRVMEVFLIGFETAVIAVTIRLIQLLAPAANARALVIIGIALNPAPIYLVCQHCNFDVIMVLWVLLAIMSLMRYNTSNDLADWLLACLFIGLGILTKTVPLALVPLLAGGFRQATAPARLMGAALVLGPVTLGMSVIYVLSPEEITHGALSYRGFGYLEGILHLMDCDEFSRVVRLAFYIAGLGIMAVTWHHLWTKHSLGNRELVLYTALILLVISGEGAAFGAEYFYWFLPLLVITYACYDGLWRALLIGFWIVSAVTFIINYGLIPAFGYNFLFLLSHTKTQEDLYQAVLTSHDPFFHRVVNWSYQFGQLNVETWAALPLCIAGVLLLIFGTHLLLNSVEGLRKKWVLGLAGFYVLYICVIFAMALGMKCFGPGKPASGDSTPSQTNFSP